MASPDKVTGSVVMIGAVLVMTIFAGVSDQLGKVLVIIMLGFLLLFLMGPGSALIHKWLGAINAPSGSGGTKLV